MIPYKFQTKMMKIFLIIILIIANALVTGTTQGKAESPSPPHGVPYSGGPYKWEVTYAPDIDNPIIVITNYLCSFEISFEGPSSSSTTVMRGETKYLVLNPGFYSWETNKLPNQSCILRSASDATFDEHYIYHLIGGDGEIPEISNIINNNPTIVESSNPVYQYAKTSDMEPITFEAEILEVKDKNEIKINEILVEYSNIYSYYADISENAEEDQPFKILEEFGEYAEKLSKSLKPKITDIPTDILNPYSYLVDSIKIMLSFQSSMGFLYEADFLVQLAEDKENSQVLQDIAPKLRKLSEISKNNPSDINGQKQLITSIKLDLAKINYERYLKEGVNAEPIILETTISEGESFLFEIDLPLGTKQINYKYEQKEDNSLLGIGSKPKYILMLEESGWIEGTPKFIGNSVRYWNGYDLALSWFGYNQPQTRLHLNITCIDTGGDINLLVWKREGPKTATVIYKFAFEPNKSSYYGMGEFLKNYKNNLIEILENHEELIQDISTKTISVDDDFIDDPINHQWDTIQEGMQDANNGDTIIVKSGKYPEKLIIDKQIKMKGEDYPIIDGEGTGTVILIQADAVHLEGFKVGHSDLLRENMEEGIRISNNDKIVITNCIIADNNIGVGVRGQNNLIINNEFKDNRIGLVIGDGEQNTIKNNHFSNNNLILGGALNNIIKNNIFEFAPHFGISIYDISNDNEISYNTMRLNSMGAIEISESMWGPTSHNNKIHHNNFISNGYQFQTYDDGNNYWDDGSEGNHWSDYEGVDTDNNGIGDSPYDKIGNYKTEKKSGFQDNYPLIVPLTTSTD